ncbi:MAG: hypothetical protein GX611_06190 [Clostridiales bacterium]|nr:hypothetical protein [Clostridiales bacterium]
MKAKKFAGRLLTLIMMMVMLTGAAYAEGSTLHDLLAIVPAPEEGARVFLSYVDVDAMMKARPAEFIPKNADEHFLPAAQPYRMARMGVVAGSPELQMALLMPDAEAVNGFSPFAVKRSLYLGHPPYQQTWLTGDFEEAPLTGALTAQDYQMMEAPQGGFAVWCPDGDCSIGHNMDMNRRNAASLFGGSLGRRWPIALFPGVLATAPDEKVFEGIINQQGPSLSELPAVQAMLKLLQPEGAPPPSQLILVDAGDGMGEQVPGVGLMALAQVDGETALTVRLVLQFEEEAAAQAARERLDGEGLEAIQLQDNTPLTARLEDLQGQVTDLSVQVSPGAGALLVMDVSFPSQAQVTAADPESPSALPFGMFYQMFMKRDLRWLVP